MRMMRALLAVSLVLAASTALAHDEDQRGPADRILDVYSCTEPDCIMQADGEVWPNPADYRTFASVTLPPGTYSLRGKLSAYAMNWLENYQSGFGTLECYLGVDPNSQTFVLPPGQKQFMFTDWASVSYAWGAADQKSVAMEVTVSLRTRTTVGIGCKLLGYYVDPGGTHHPFQVGVWGARLIAEPVGPVIHRLAQ